ncbi:MAG: beta-galactosidase trimerization domain-containing protein [Candidatus Omnitrophica bacterium]|nr:beta-galactosidase trimerization domain-containing protein [Candidatus Omnitrophota bacterium]
MNLQWISRAKPLGCSLLWLAAVASLTSISIPNTGTAGDPLPAQNAKGSSAAGWFHRDLVGMEVGPTGAQFGHSDTNDTRFCSRFDGREIVRRCIAAHCQYVVIWARDGDFAYYASKLLMKAPGLGNRDPLREAVEEAHKHKLPIIAYCVVQQAGHFLDAHPEFEMRDPRGNRLGRFGLNSGYIDTMKQIVDEQLAYGIDGFHIDMLDQGFGPPYGCWCDTCRKLFDAEFGRPMPNGATWDDDWDRMLEFRYRSSQHFEQELCRYIKTGHPQVSVDFNYHGNPPFSFEVGQRPVQHAGNGDFNTGETGTWGFSALTVGLNAEFYRASTPGLPYQVAISRDARVYHNQTTRPLADLEWELFVLLSHGAFVTVVDKTAFDGSLDLVAYERIGDAFADALARRRQFGYPPLAEVGIYFSSRTRDWYGRENPARYFESFLGAHKAMVYDHIPWGVLLDENVSLDKLKLFPVVLLPNTVILSDNEVNLLRRYVSEGGNLIVTGLTGCGDSHGGMQKKSSLEPLSGVRFVSKLDSIDNWVRFPSSQPPTLRSRLAPDQRLDWPFLVKGPAMICEPTTATPVAELMKPYRTVRQQQGKEGTEWPMSAEAPVGPALLVNHLDRGTVLTFACSPDFAAASEHHILEARQLLRNAIRFLNPKPRVKIVAPATVETVVTDDPATRTLRVHLLGYNAPPQTMPERNRPYVLPALIEEAPMYRVAIELDRPIKDATAWNKTTSLNRRSQRLEATVEAIHEVLVLRY